jgi:hypothetical protein
LPTRSDRYDVQQKDEQIVGVPRFRWEGSVVDDLEINQSGPAGFVVVNDVCCSRIAV